MTTPAISRRVRNTLASIFPVPCHCRWWLRELLPWPAISRPALSRSCLCAFARHNRHADEQSRTGCGQRHLRGFARRNAGGRQQHHLRHFLQGEHRRPRCRIDRGRSHQDPVANYFTVQMGEGQTADINLVANASAAMQQPPGGLRFSQPAQGAVVFNATTGLFDYTPTSIPTPARIRLPTRSRTARTSAMWPRWPSWLTPSTMHRWAPTIPFR